MNTLFIKFRFKIRTGIANYQNISIIKKNLIVLTARIENNKNNADSKRLYSQRVSVDTTVTTTRNNYTKAIRISNTWERNNNAGSSQPKNPDYLKLTYYNCGKKNYISPNYRSPKKQDFSNSNNISIISVIDLKNTERSTLALPRRNANKK